MGQAENRPRPKWPDSVCQAAAIGSANLKEYNYNKAVTDQLWISVLLH